MIDLSALQNLDLLSVGTAIAGIGVLGFVVYLQDRDNATNRAVFYFAMAAILWSSFNYAYYQPFPPGITIWLLRIHAFFAVWYTYFLFNLFLTFPAPRFALPRRVRLGLLPVTCLAAAFTLTPAVFGKVTSVTEAGRISGVTQGPGIALFGSVIIFLVIAGFVIFVRKFMRAKGNVDRWNYGLVLSGGITTFILHIIFNLLLPAAYGNPSYIPLGAVFIFPFILATSYAILENKLFNVKVAATALLVFAISTLMFFEIIFSTELYLVLFRVSLLVLVLIFGISLMGSVLREVKQREEIERLSEEKSEFMTFASHEIRNPVTAMRGYASLISDGTTGEVGQTTKDAAEKILVTGNEVLSLIAQFLSKSKLELGQITFNKDTFDLGSAVAAVADGYAPHARQKGLQLSKHIEASHRYEVQADEAKVKEVVGNIIDNSLKYTQKGGITVSVERHGVNVRAVIEDTGVGIAPETLPHLFKKFSRADAEKANLLGTGVGLYLARTFIEGMGGRIWAESEGKDKGSRFIVEFPAAA